MSKANGYTRQEVLNAIKLHGPQTADDLATRLGISSVAVRQHVGSLESEGLVATAIERRGLGRPVHRYGLTTSGDETFPRHYDQLAMSLLEDVKSIYGEEAVEALLVARRKRAADMLKLKLSGLTPRERVAALVDVQNEQGYMVSVEEDGHEVVLREHNCPICRVAKSYPATCREELELFRQALGPECVVEPIESAAKGDRACAYRVRLTDEAVADG